MIDFLLSLVLVGLLVGIVAVGWAARNTRVSSAVALGVAAFCGVALLAMLITDWPTGVLADFWAEHSVLAAVLTTVLTVGFAFMAYEVHDLKEQVRLHDNVSAAGLGGVVEPLSAVRRALELAAGDREPDMSGSKRPLKWLVGHELESRGQAEGTLGQQAWQRELVDQAIRRLAVAMRDWGPLISTSRRGLIVLEDMGRLRLDLMRVKSHGGALGPVWEGADDLVERVAEDSMRLS